MLTAFLIINTILFVFLAIIWNPSDLFNALLKTVFIVLSLWGAACIVLQFIPSLILENGVIVW